MFGHRRERPAQGVYAAAEVRSDERLSARDVVGSGCRNVSYTSFGFSQSPREAIQDAGHFDRCHQFDRLLGECQQMRHN